MNIKDKLLLFIKGSSDGSSSSNGQNSISKTKKVREKKITRLHLILAGLGLVTLLVVGIVIKTKLDNKETIYKEYEEQLVTSADLYYEINDLKVKDGATERIDANELIDANLVNIDSKVLDECDGYVETVSQKDYTAGEYVITRKAYIKCGNKYKTVNYISE